MLEANLGVIVAVNPVSEYDDEVVLSITNHKGSGTSGSGCCSSVSTKESSDFNSLSANLEKMYQAKKVSTVGGEVGKGCLQNPSHPDPATYSMTKSMQVPIRRDSPSCGPLSIDSIDADELFDVNSPTVCSLFNYINGNRENETNRPK